MRITAKGQVTIPKDMRDRLGLQPETEIEFVAEDDVLRLEHSPASQRGGNPVKRMRSMATGGMNTDGI